MCLNNTAKNEIPAFYKRIIQLLIKRWCFKNLSYYTLIIQAENFTPNTTSIQTIKTGA